jgi:hypothetical protein
MDPRQTRMALSKDVEFEAEPGSLPVEFPQYSCAYSIYRTSALNLKSSHALSGPIFS